MEGLLFMCLIGLEAVIKDNIAVNYEKEFECIFIEVKHKDIV